MRASGQTSPLPPRDDLHVRRAVLVLRDALAGDPADVDRVEVAVGRPGRRGSGSSRRCAWRNLVLRRAARRSGCSRRRGRSARRRTPLHLRVARVERVRRVHGVVRVERVLPRAGPGAGDAGLLVAFSQKRRNRSAPREPRFSCRSQAASTSHARPVGHRGAARCAARMPLKERHIATRSSRVSSPAYWRSLNTMLCMLLARESRRRSILRRPWVMSRPMPRAQRARRALVADDPRRSPRAGASGSTASSCRSSSSRSRARNSAGSLLGPKRRAAPSRDRCPTRTPNASRRARAARAALNVAVPSAVSHCCACSFVTCGIDADVGVERVAALVGHDRVHPRDALVALQDRELLLRGLRPVGLEEVVEDAEVVGVRVAHREARSRESTAAARRRACVSIGP